MEQLPERTDECYRVCYREGDVAKVEALLDAGVDINVRAPCSGAAPWLPRTAKRFVPTDDRFTLE